jgi:hypothetical protein
MCLEHLVSTTVLGMYIHWSSEIKFMILPLIALVTGFQIAQKPLVDPLGSVTWCSSPEDVFVPQQVTLQPDPPRRGELLKIYVKGLLKETVDQGSFAHVKVKLGFIQLVDHNYDICEQVTQVGKQCPLEKGELVIEHQVDIPKELPFVMDFNLGSISSSCGSFLTKQYSPFLSRHRLSNVKSKSILFLAHFHTFIDLYLFKKII